MDPEESALRNQQLANERERRRAEHDAIEGMGWWNDLTTAQRREWLNRAQSSVPAEAWKAYKADRDAERR